MNYFSGCVFVLALVFVGCKQANKQKTPIEFTHQHGEEVEEIVLNNGKKWHVDSVMMLIIKDMNESISGRF